MCPIPATLTDCGRMIVIVLSTCNRPAYAAETLESFIRFLKTEDRVRLHIADDGTENKESLQRLMDRACTVWKTQPSFTSVYRLGLGPSLDAALPWVEEGNLWMYAADEWCLTRHLYLDRAAKFVREYDYDVVRLGPINPGLVCTTRFDPELGWWLDLEEPQVSLAARPFLANWRLIRRDIFPKFICYDGAIEVDYADLKIASINMRGPWKNLANPLSGRMAVSD